MKKIYFTVILSAFILALGGAFVNGIIAPYEPRWLVWLLASIPFGVFGAVFADTWGK